jgi:hypothetical protein
MHLLDTRPFDRRTMLLTDEPAAIGSAAKL